MDEKLKEKLLELAQRRVWSDHDEFDPSGSSGGSYDKAFYGGQTDGETGLAREILAQFGVPFQIPAARQ